MGRSDGHIREVVRSRKSDIAVAYFPLADGVRPVRVLKLGAETGLQKRQLLACRTWQSCTEIYYIAHGEKIPASPFDSR